MPEFSRISLARLDTCNYRLRRLFNEVIRHKDCTIICGYRTHEKQEEAYRTGHSTKPPGTSRHNSNPSTAVDVAPWPIDWYNAARFERFAFFVMGVASQMGVAIRWGGDWDGDWETNDQTFNDLAHFEIIDTDKDDVDRLLATTEVGAT